MRKFNSYAQPTSMAMAASDVVVAAFVGERPDFGIREFLLRFHSPGSSMVEDTLGEELPWVEIRDDGWYIRGWYRLPASLKSKVKFRALKLLRQHNRRG